MPKVQEILTAEKKLKLNNYFLSNKCYQMIATTHTGIFVNMGQSEVKLNFKIYFVAFKKLENFIWESISWWYRNQLGTTETLFTKALTYIPGLRKWNALNF